MRFEDSNGIFKFFVNLVLQGTIEEVSGEVYNS